MRLVMTLMIRDEIDIVEANLTYHLREGFDHIIVTDNGSVDGTRDVIGDYARRYPITIIDEPASDWSQHRWVTRMARMAHEQLGATWIVHNDADEFYVAKGTTLRDVLASVKADVDRLSVQRHDFVPIERPEQQAPPIEMIFRKAVSRNPAGMLLPPKIIHRGAADVVLTQGNHTATSASFRGEPAATAIQTFHYPIRSPSQFASKARNAGSGYERNNELPATVGKKMRYWYRLLQEGRLDAEYQTLAYDAARLAAGLQTGELLEETHLRDRLVAMAVDVYTPRSGNRIPVPL